MADSDPGRGPEAAHILLGLPETASREALEGAYWRLRGHIEERLRGSDDPEFAQARQTELATLHEALLAVPGVVVADPGSRPPAAVRAPRWLVAWSIFSVPVVLWVVGRALLGGGIADRAPGGDPPVDPSSAVGARLVVDAEPSSAELTVTTGEDARVVLTTPADGSPHELPAGEYALAVAHPDCPDAWSQAIGLEAGEERRYAPRLCDGEGRIVVRSNVSGDRVRIDGIDVGSTGSEPHSVRVGKHRVQVDKEGYAPWSGEVAIVPEAEVTLIAELSAIAPTAAAAAPASQAAQTPAPAAQAASPPPSPPGTAPDATPGPDRAGGMMVEDAAGKPIRVRTGKGGSKSWHDAIKQDLVSQYDRNGSGSLDTPAEIDAIPCETWRNIEKSYETGGLAVEMTTLYGFDGSEAPANTLGVTAAVRDHAYDRMKACGLKARR